MVVLEVGKGFSSGTAPVKVCKSVLLYGLCQTDDFIPIGVKVSPLHNPQNWAPICTNGGVNKG